MAHTIRLLIADDDALMRSLLVASAHDTVEGVEVLEAADGAEAVQLGLQQRPQIALLDVHMPRLGGIEAAVTLRDLLPGLRIALQTSDPAAYRDRARAGRLQLFDKLELDATLAWLARQAAAACRQAEPAWA